MAGIRTSMERILKINLRRCGRSMLNRHSYPGRQMKRMLFVSCQKCAAIDSPMPLPQKDGEPKIYAEKITNIVTEISKLTLAEVSDLNTLLKETLNIQDAPLMPMGGVMAAPLPAQEVEPEPVKEEQTEFTIKLTKFDDGSKVKLIKEIKALMPEMNLVQAKKFVESAPKVIKEKITKEDADKIKKQLEAVGGSVEIE